MKDKDNKKKHRKTSLLILIILLIFISIVYVVCHYNKTATLPTISGFASGSRNSDAPMLDYNGNALKGSFKEKSKTATLSELQKEQVIVTDKISSAISFSSGKKGTIGNWVVENPASNNVIMQCEVFLDKRLIAKSVPIKPGQHIETITLSDNVKPGQYNVTAYINYYSTDTGSYISKAGYKIKMMVR